MDRPRRSNTGFVRLFALLLCLNVPLLTKAWWDPGHMVTAQIAYQNLDKSVRQKADDLIDVLKKAYPYTSNFVEASCWPDDLKSEGVHLYDTWHYTNIPYNPDGVALPPKPEVDVIWAIGKCGSILSSTKTRPIEKARALAFMIHFVGDIHQPLHSTTMYSNELPGGNRGGNHFDIDESHGNLHKLWDDGCGYLSHLNDIRPYRAVKEANTSDEMKRLKEMAKKIIKAHPEKKMPEAAQLDPKFWAMESHNLAVKYAYRGFNGMKGERKTFLSPGGKPSPEYIAKGQEIVAERVALGGYRLARLLNQLLGE
ncbi:MAG: S1/P1 nuclease [Bacteroidota bacterium]